MRPPEAGAPPPAFRLDRADVRRSFERASASYDSAAVLQGRVRTELLDRLRWIKLEPVRVLDLGSGTGEGARQLKRRYPRALTLALDIAPGMLREARRRSRPFRRFERVCGDAYRLPLADASLDLVFGNLLLQWCDAPDAVLAEIRRVLRPGGFFSFSTFGPDTLSELRTAWAAADDASHVNAFLDMHDVGDALTRAQFAEPVLDVERFTLSYGDVLALMRDLKAIGAHNVTSGRHRGLTGRGKWRVMTAEYETFRRDDRLPATYEVIYGAAWRGEASATSGSGEIGSPGDSEVRISPAAIRRRPRP
ncbi:MAG TPA: malonyl-ACP O-methyltransferase BioC [Steroidobacteraceae bacterium]|nr:malonyl-ACP O-methyltransferase BioC [Steroidobacteraceae bacterium]